LAYVLSDGPQTWLAVQELEQPAPRLYQVEPGVHYTPVFTPDGGHLIFVFDNPRQPDDLWKLELEDGSFEQLTHSLPAELAQADFIMPQHIEYPSLDGKPVPALLYLPTPVGRFSEITLPPAVVVIHGGPTWLFQYLWYPVMTHLASRGWVVLAPNYRGSSGYGREWQHANRFDIGHGDTMDVAAGVDYLVSHGLADPQRIAVTGRSHGGYLTMSCLTQYPERWAGGSAVVPFLNWFTSHANSRVDLQHWDIENMGDPVENEALWRERSPYFYLDRIQTPVQLICGANDPRCPASESLQARDALLALGKQVDFILYPDEGHTFLKIQNIVEHELRRVAFLATCLE
jgi:dipeptidyl aminopeptidase/acylaminoacyl peptidase